MTINCYSAPPVPKEGEVAGPYWKSLLSYAESLGLASTLSAPSGEGAVSVESFLTLLKCGLSADQDFGLNAGRLTTLGTYPVLGVTLLSCRDMRQALEQVVRYECLSHDLGASALSVHQDNCEYTWLPNSRFVDSSDDALNLQLVSYVFSGIKTFIPWLVNKPIPLIRVDFTGQAPKDSASYRAHFGDNVFFGQAKNRLVADRSIMDWSISNADTTLFPTLQQHAETLIQHRRSTKGRSAIQQALDEILPEALRNQSFHIELIAKKLNVGTRTLQRQLKESNTNFINEVEKARQTLAEYYLSSTTHSINEIAFLVGYQEQSSFNRAFKSWYDLTPGAYRKKYL